MNMRGSAERNWATTHVAAETPVDKSICGLRFLADIARAARDRGDAEALGFAAEALWTDNEALESAEPVAGVREPRAKYKARWKKR
jgi:hypothetical protein